MCSELYIAGERILISQARELAALVGRENMLWWGADEETFTEPDNFRRSDLAYCLCPIAVDETMRLAGYDVTTDDFGDYVANRMLPENPQ